MIIGVAVQFSAFSLAQRAPNICERCSTCPETRRRTTDSPVRNAFPPRTLEASGRWGIAAVIAELIAQGRRGLDPTASRRAASAARRGWRTSRWRGRAAGGRCLRAAPPPVSWRPARRPAQAAVSRAGHRGLPRARSSSTARDGTAGIAAPTAIRVTCQPCQAPVMAAQIDRTVWGTDVAPNRTTSPGGPGGGLRPGRREGGGRARDGRRQERRRARSACRRDGRWCGWDS